MKEKILLDVVWNVNKIDKGLDKRSERARSTYKLEL